MCITLIKSVDFVDNLQEYATNQHFNVYNFVLKSILRKITYSTEHLIDTA